MPGYCGAWSLVSEDTDGVKHAIPMRCRSWGCSVCGKRNRRRLLARLEGTTGHSLLTLTCNPARYPDPPTAFRHMSLAVNVLLRRLRRDTPGNSIEYFLVWERTRHGWPHAHLILQAPYIPQARISSLWAALTGAPVVDIRSARGLSSVVSYVAKYLTKDPAAPPGSKRFRHSRRFMLAAHNLRPGQADKPRYWTLVRSTAAELALDWSLDGLTCHLHADGSTSAYPAGHPDSPLYPSPALMNHASVRPFLMPYAPPAASTAPYTGLPPLRYASPPSPPVRATERTAVSSHDPPV